MSTAANPVPQFDPESIRADVRENARSLKWLLQGHWMRHPIHPALAHLPAGLWPTALVLYCITFASSGDLPSLNLAAWWCILIGLVVACAAVPTGIAEWADIKPNKPARSMGIIHLGLNGMTFGIFVAVFIIHSLHGLTQPHGTLAELILSAVGAGLLLISGYIGSRMVYDQGIHVGRDSKAYWREIARLDGANLPPQ